MKEREKEIASAGKRTTDLSLVNPSQHNHDMTLIRAKPRINHMAGDYARLPRGVLCNTV